MKPQVRCGNMPRNECSRRRANVPGAGRHLNRGDDMADRMCSVEGCDLPHLARGWCSMHYQRWNAGRAVGAAQPQRAKRFPPGTPEIIRFLAKVDKNGPIAKNRPDLGRCWIWTASLAHGYGQFFPGSRLDGTIRRVPSHRWAYEHWVGPIPEGLVLDHFACDNPPCVNPSHVTPTTQRVNVTIRSQTSVSGINVRKSRCPAGHLYPDERNARGRRVCEQCFPRYNENRRAKRKRKAS